MVSSAATRPTSGRSPGQTPPSARPRPLNVATVATVCALAVAHELLIGRSGFFLDDFRNLADARRMGLSTDLLTEPLFEHFAPGHRLMDWLAAEPLGRNFRYASALETAWMVVLLGSFAGLLRTVWGAWLWQLLPLIVVGLSWSLAATNQWFAAGAHVTPSLALGMLSVLLAARWGTTRRQRYAIASVVAGFCGVLFWIQAVIAPLLATLVLSLLVDRAGSPQELVASLRRRCAYIVCHFAVMGVFLAWLVTRPWRPDLGSPDLDQVVALARVVAFRGVLPSLLGKGLPNEELSTSDATWQVVALGVPVALLVFAVVTRRRWIAGLTLIATAYVALVAMIAAGRLAQNGPLIGNEPRYVAFLVPVVLLGLVTMLQPTPRTPPLAFRGPVRVTGVAIAALLVTLIGLNVRRTADASFWRATGMAGKTAAAQLGAQLAQLDAAAGRRLVDGELTPPFFYTPERGSDNTLMRLVPFFSPALHPLGDSSSGPLLRVDGTALNAVAFHRIGATVRVACKPRRRCTADVAGRRPLSGGAHVQIHSQRRTLLSATIAPADGVATKDDPREVLASKQPSQVLTGPVWAGSVRRARVTIEVTTPAELRVAFGVLEQRRP